MSLREQLKMLKVGMSRKEVSLSPHNANWFKAFVVAETALKEKIPTGFELHHIGSTSISGIHAKPVLDILGVVSSIEEFENYKSTLEALGFVWKGEYGIANRRYCVLYDEAEEMGLVHLHVFAKSDSEVEKHLIFRDFLRSSEEASGRYEAVKLKLAQSFKGVRANYSEGKSEIITQLLTEAFDWKKAGEKKQQVVAAIIGKNDKFLLGKRALTKKLLRGIGALFADVLKRMKRLPMPLNVKFLKRWVWS